MFGYIKPHRSELRVRENECYGAMYCGLCHSMGRTCGRAFCGTLSYDFAFLGIMRMAMTGSVPEFEKRRCAAHPFRKRNAVKDNEQLRYCGAAAAILGYGKIKDDLTDERGAARLKARLMMPFFKRARKKALKKLPQLAELDERVSGYLFEMSELEKASGLDEVSADRIGELFGRIMGEILSFGTEGGDRLAAKAFGEALGKWLYIMDAADDYAEDEKKKRFNPFVIFWSRDGGFTRERRELLAAALKAYLFDAEKALDLMELGGCREFYEIARNILYLGMPQEAERVLDIKTNDGDERPSKK